MNRTVRCALLAAALMALAPSTASADSLFYVKAGDIYAAKPDGSGEVRLTADRGNSWPSQADNGTWALAGFADGKIYRYGPDGKLINSMTTSGSYAAGKPEHVRISPDGSKIAYRILYFGDYHVFWTPSNSTNIDTPGQSLGQESYGSPDWIGNDYLYLSHNGATVTDTQPAFATYHVGDGDNTLNDGGTDDTSWPNAYASAISRDGGRVAAIEADTGDGSGTRTELHIFTTSARVPTSLTLKCSITLPNYNIYYSSPTFSPDGTRLAFAEPDGVHIATLGDLSGCPAQQPLVVAGANQVFWGPADPPVISSGGGGSGGGGGGGGGGGQADTAAPTTQLALMPGFNKIKTALSKGLDFSVNCNEPCSWNLSASLDAKTAKKIGLLKKKSKAKSVKVAGGSLGLGSGKRTAVAKFTSSAKKKLKKLKAFKLTVVTKATDAAGNAAPRSAKVSLRK